MRAILPDSVNEKLSNRVKLYSGKNKPPALLGHPPATNNSGTTGSGWTARVVSIPETWRRIERLDENLPKWSRRKGQSFRKNKYRR